MILAAVQYKPPKGQTQIARAELTAYVEKAAINHADIIVCPEMAVSGYVWENAEDVYPHTELENGETFDCLSPIARKYGVWIICGIAERQGESLYNSAIVISSTGELVCCYRKILLYDSDFLWAQSGNQRMIIQTEHGSLAPAICMDLNDDRLLYWLWAEKPDILAFCSNWLNEGTTIDDYWKMRTVNWNGWMIGANCWGEDKGTEFRGESAILDGSKETLVKAPIEGNCIIYCDTLNRACYPKTDS
jgi:N-carbamoylputrescine amidase